MNALSSPIFRSIKAVRSLHSVLFLLCFIPFTTLAQTPLRYDVVGKANWAPYFTQNKENPGIIVEVIQEVLSKAEIPLLPIESTTYSTPSAIENGEVDVDVISPSWFKDNKVPEEYIISARIIPIAEYIVYRTGGAGQWPNREALYNKHVGVVKDYKYHDEKNYIRDEYPSERDLLLAIKSKQTDVGIVGELPLYYWANNLGISVERGPLHSRGYLHIRINKKNVEYLKLINKAIANLQQSGEIDRIFESYQSLNLAP